MDSPTWPLDLTAEWKVWLSRIDKDSAEDTNRAAQRWVLIHAFGNLTDFHFNAEFHARVALAEQMLNRINEERRRMDQ